MTEHEQWISGRVRGLMPSATLRINTLAKEYKAQGKPVLSFATGEPDFPTPLPIVEAAIKALQAGKTKYTPTPGIPELRAAIARRYQEKYGVLYDPDAVVVTIGGKQALYNLFQTILNPGDEVVFFSPYWVSYAEQIKLAGGVPVAVQTDLTTGFIPDPGLVASAITAQTKAILINSPNNPTGAVYPREVLQSLAELALKHDLLLISDEIYEDLVYTGVHTCLPTLALSGVKERTVVVSGVSKSFSMTGWRLGWAVGPEAIIKGMSDLQSHATSNAASVSQYAALAALTQDLPELANMAMTFQERREVMYDLLRAIPGLQVALPQGAFYLFVDLRGLPGFQNSETFCRDLLVEALVATVPGEAFGAPGHMRLSYATSRADIEEGCRRIAAFVEKIRGE
mgnify:CR=1 FL=1